MTDSRTTHGVLTERVRENTSGKGREGNKEGKGSRVETSIHSSSSVMREPRIGWMAATRFVGGIR